ncbi:MAG: type III secretion system effector protein [Paludibacteraceae bacterium]|nr:type III secretion system effector protein [Paludibacteraceae bacterium]
MDPDGNEIKIGTWYGRVLAKLGVDNFEAKVQKQLNNIKSISPGLNQMVTDLEKSKNTYSIKSVSEHPDNKRETDSRSGNSYRKSDKTIYFDMDKTTGYDGKERPLEAALAHELGHAEDDKNGNRIDYDRNKLNNHDVIEMDKCQRNEINAISRENEVRDAMGYPERDYNYFTVKKEDN